MTHASISFVSTHIADMPQLTVSKRMQIGSLQLDVLNAGNVTGYCSVPNEAELQSCYLLLLPREGSVSAGGFCFREPGRKKVSLEQGDYILLDGKSFCELDVGPQTCLIAVRIPARELQTRLISIDDHIGRRFEPDGDMSRLLSDFISGIVSSFSQRQPPNPEALATEIVNLVLLAVGAEGFGNTMDVRTARYRLRRRVFDFIERNIRNENLSPRDIATSCRISVSYLYTLLRDDDTTVGRLLQMKRLQKAYEILASDIRGHRTVAEVAYEVGFKNVSHFSRSFSRHFSVAPREVRTIGSNGDAAVVRN